MPFGCHRGRAMEKVPAHYLDWLSAQDWLPEKYPAVDDYIKRMRKAIDDELDVAGLVPYRFAGGRRKK